MNEQFLPMKQVKTAIKKVKLMSLDGKENPTATDYD